MRRIATIILLSLIGFNGLSQSASIKKGYYKRYLNHIPEFHLYSLPIEKRDLKVFINANGVESIQVQTDRLTKQGALRKAGYWTKFSFNSNAEIQWMEGAKAGQSKTYEIRYSKPNDSTKVMRHVNDKGEVVETKIERTHSDRIGHLEKITLDKKGDTTLFILLGGIDENTLSSADYYIEKGKLKYSWENTYNEDLTIKKAIFKGKGGKVKYIWDYSCNTIGTEIQKQKETTTVCTIKEKNTDGNTITIKHFVDEKGKTTRSIVTRNKFGKIIESSYLYGASEKYNTKVTYFYDATDTIKTKMVKQRLVNEVKIWESTALYNSNGHLTSKTSYNFDKKGNTNGMVYKYTFDEAGKPITKEQTKTTLLATKKWKTKYVYELRKV